MAASDWFDLNMSPVQLLVYASRYALTGDKRSV